MTGERIMLLSKDMKGNFGPCMITFSIPLLIPGITLTLVGFGNEPGLSMYGSVHILGIVVLVLAIIIFIMGCVFKCLFKHIRVSPIIEEIHRVVTTHDKLNQNGNNSNDYHIKTVVCENNYNNNNRHIYGNNINCKQHLSSSSSISPSTNDNKTPNYVMESSSTSQSVTSQTGSKISHQSDQNYLFKPSGMSVKNNDRLEEQYHKGNKQSDVPNSELYPLGRLPSLDLKHTKFSYSSQDKPDEEMSIVDETNGPCHSPDLNPSAKSHLGDLPNIHREMRKRSISEGSDNTSYTSTDSISGHIIRTNRDDYTRKDSSHFPY